MGQILTFNGFEPNEEDMYRMAIRQPLDRKIKNAVGLLQSICADKKVCVAFSGGKDSIVIKRLAQMAGIDFDAVYSVTTIDPPELVRYIKKHHPGAIWRRQDKHLLVALADGTAGFPMRKNRWCCRLYKENTSNDYDTQIIGVRAEESTRRKGLWKQVNADRKKKGGVIICPIVYWTDQDVWGFIKSENLPYCELYDQGWKRLGCVGCPLAGEAHMRKEFKRWPGFEKLWHTAIVRWWEKWHNIPKKDGSPRFGSRFASGEELWNWFLTRKPVSDMEQMELDVFEETGECGDDADCQSRYYTL